MWSSEVRKALLSPDGLEDMMLFLWTNAVLLITGQWRRLSIKSRKIHY